MALPKIDVPIFMLDLPSSKLEKKVKKIKYRPFTVKEEKILLIAAEDGTPEAVKTAISQILTNCILNEDIDIETLTMYDVEYIFIKLRSVSVGNKVDLHIMDEYEQMCETSIDLNDVEVKFDDEHEQIIKLNKDISITMNHPTFRIFEDFSAANRNEVDIIRNSIDKVMTGKDEVVSMSDHTLDEQEAFVNSFTFQNLEEIQKFFTTMPLVSHDCEYEDSKGKKHTKTLEGLNNFFTLG